MPTENEEHWVMSERYKGYACCPVCHDCFIDPKWIVDFKWNFCPTCGTRLLPPIATNDH